MCVCVCVCGFCSPVGGIRMTRRAAVIGQSDALLYYYFSGIFPTVINYFIYLYCSYTPTPHYAMYWQCRNQLVDSNF